MSIKINGTTITMTRGDTLRTKLSIFDSAGNPYVPCEDDHIRFALKQDYADETPLILKEIPWDTLMLVLASDDTKILDQPGSYVYDIQITMSDGTVDTFITKAKLKLTEEVD